MHDKIRKGMQRYANLACKDLIKNGKYFVEPQKSSDNFKVLFARLAAEGAGRPVDEQGVPDGPWTPDALADAISAIDANQNGIEVRAVQVWFQNNDNGISNDNIRWLARIFGCDDPEATSQWQAELTASRERLSAERRAKRKKMDDVQPQADTGEIAVSSAPPNEGAKDQKIKGISLALRSEAMFSGSNRLNMPIFIWGGLGVLWFLAFIFGVASVTYSPFEGLDKQVGLIWSPGWNIGEPIFLPIFLIAVSGLLNMWKHTDRLRLISVGGIDSIDHWSFRVRSSWLSYWAVLFICFFLIFLVQWAGVYLFPFLANDPDVPMIDWMLIALVEPDVLSTDAAILMSFLAFLYSGLIYWFLFIGLLLLYTITADFVEICSSVRVKDHQPFMVDAQRIGTKIIECVYRSTILGIIIAFSIKLNAAYLISDAESISSWLWHDASIFLGFRTDEWAWIQGSPSSFFTSFLLLFLLCFVFIACAWPIKTVLDRAAGSPDEKRKMSYMWLRMAWVLTLLAGSYLLTGLFFGFSLFVVLSIVVSIVSLFWRISDFVHRPIGRQV